MVPFETFDDKEQGRRTLTFDKLLEAQISGDYKYNRPCVVLGADKQSCHIIMAEMRSNRDKPFRSEVNNFELAGIDHKSALLVRQENSPKKLKRENVNDYINRTFEHPILLS